MPQSAIKQRNESADYVRVLVGETGLTDPRQKSGNYKVVIMMLAYSSCER